MKGVEQCVYSFKSIEHESKYNGQKQVKQLHRLLTTGRDLLRSIPSIGLMTR